MYLLEQVAPERRKWRRRRNGGKERKKKEEVEREEKTWRENIKPTVVEPMGRACPSILRAVAVVTGAVGFPQELIQEIMYVCRYFLLEEMYQQIHWIFFS